MPYNKNEELPASVKNTLPGEAQTVFREIVNSALDTYEGDETKAFATAWQGLRNAGWEKDDKGKWVKVDEIEKHLPGRHDQKSHGNWAHRRAGKPFVPSKTGLGAKAPAAGGAGQAKTKEPDGKPSPAATKPSNSKPAGEGRKEPDEITKQLIGAPKKVTLGSKPGSWERIKEGDVRNFTKQHLGKEMGSRELASLAGDIKGANISLRFRENGEIAINSVGMRGSKVLYSLDFTLKKTKDGAIDLHYDMIKNVGAPKGFGTRMLATSVANCQKHGVDRISLHAAGEKGAKFNGYYTWPRMGFNQALESSFKRELSKDKDLPAQLRKAKTVQDLMVHPEGRKWWKENGSDLERCAFEIKKGSPSMQILGAYLKESGVVLPKAA